MSRPAVRLTRAQQVALRAVNDGRVTRRFTWGGAARWFVDGETAPSRVPYDRLRSADLLRVLPKPVGGDRAPVVITNAGLRALVALGDLGAIGAMDAVGGGS